MSQVLLIEDAVEFQKMVVRSLGHCSVAVADRAEMAFELLSEKKFDLIILDLSLPTKDGYAVMADLQADPNLKHIPVIFLTGRTGVADKVTAFSLGAEDYIVKPFDPIELRARVDAKITKRDREKELASVTTAGPLEIDHDTHRVFRVENGLREEIVLTQTEFKLLSHLTKKIDRAYSRDQLLIAVWGADARVLDRAVDTHICSLRKKMGDLGKSIKAVPSVGYKFQLTKASKKKAA